MKYTWDMNTGEIKPVFPAQESWEDILDETLLEMQDWLSDLDNVDAVLAEVAKVLRSKHHDYGEDNLKDFGELGILVRASDKVSRLKNLIDKAAEVEDENRADTWRDLAGYAIQALILMKMSVAINNAEKEDVFVIRKDRLIRGFCPDCGDGVLLRLNFWDDRLQCSERCGFSTGDLYGLHLNFPDFSQMINFLASQPAFTEQK